MDIIPSTAESSVAELLSVISWKPSAPADIHDDVLWECHLAVNRNAAERNEVDGLSMEGEAKMLLPVHSLPLFMVVVPL